MDLFVVIMLCILGNILILLEVFLIPGITLATIGGIISTSWGIYHAFNYFGFYFGLLVLISAISLITLSIVYIVKSKSINKIALNTKIDSILKIEKISEIKEGDEGVTLSRLNLIGKVEVNHIIMEGKSVNQLIDENTPIIVLKITPMQLIVKKK